MEIVSVFAGERWRDAPRCTHPLLAAIGRLVNDAMRDPARQRLHRRIPDLIGTTRNDPVLTAALLHTLAHTSRTTHLHRRMHHLASEANECARSWTTAGVFGRLRHRIRDRRLRRYTVNWMLVPLIQEHARYGRDTALLHLLDRALNTYHQAPHVAEDNPTRRALRVPVSNSRWSSARPWRITQVTKVFPRPLKICPVISTTSRTTISGGPSCGGIGSGRPAPRRSIFPA